MIVFYIFAELSYLWKWIKQKESSENKITKASLHFLHFSKYSKKKKKTKSIGEHIKSYYIVGET